MTLNFPSFCLDLPNAGIIGVCHGAWFLWDIICHSHSDCNTIRSYSPLLPSVCAGKRCLTTFVLCCCCWRARLLARISKAEARCSKITMQIILTSTALVTVSLCRFLSMYYVLGWVFKIHNFSETIQPAILWNRHSRCLLVNFLTLVYMQIPEALVRNRHSNHAQKHRRTLTHNCLLAQTHRDARSTFPENVYF